MFSLFKKEKKSKLAPSPDFCQRLFANLSLESLGKYEYLGEPWSLFCKVKNEFETGNRENAIGMLKKAVNKAGIGSCNYIQTWYFLRELGVFPEAKEGKKVCGVVIEVALAEGVDTVAVYEDLTARYLRYTGQSFLWERPKTSLDAKVQGIYNAGKNIVAQIEPWEKGKPVEPEVGNIRVNNLTPEGIYFVEAPTSIISVHKDFRPVIDGAYDLMQELTRINSISI